MGAFYMCIQNSIDNHSTNSPDESSAFFDKTKTGGKLDRGEKKKD